MLLRTPQEGDHTAYAKDWACNLGLGGSGGLTAAVHGCEMMGFGDPRDDESILACASKIWQVPTTALMACVGRQASGMPRGDECRLYAEGGIYC